MRSVDRDRLRRALGDGLRPPAVVLDVSFVNGLEAIRSLARVEAPVLAVDHRPAALGLRSRLATGLLAPDPADEPAYLAFLHELHDELHEQAVVFATHDAPLELVARHQAELPALQLVGSGWDVLEPLQRKRVQLAAAERAGVQIPRTFHPQSRAEAEAAAAELRYPAIVKPSSGVEFKRRFGRPVLVCERRRRPGAGLRGRARQRADAAGGRPRRRRLALDGRLVHHGLGAAARAVQRAQAPADAPELRHLPDRRGALARGRRAATRCGSCPSCRSTGSPRPSCGSTSATASCG